MFLDDFSVIVLIFLAILVFATALRRSLELIEAMPPGGITMANVRNRSRVIIPAVARHGFG